MKTSLILLSGVFLSGLASASEYNTQALIRSENMDPIIEYVTLTDLVSTTSFDGEHFKIVKGKDSEAVSFDAEEHLRVRAATTYLHLTRARQYFIHHVKSAYVANLPKMTIRIDHSNAFSELGHFANDALDPQFNNALSVPAGSGYAPRNVKPWGMEIWFRPMKHVNIKDIQVRDVGIQEFNALMGNFRNQIHMQSFSKFLTNLILSVTDPSADVKPFSQENLIRTVGASLMLELGIRSVEPLSKALARKWYWLDTAMVPEIIYHEYSHIALSDRLVLSHSTAVIEGMADFFAGQIGSTPKLAKKIKEYNTFNGKNAKRKQQYQVEFESTEYANTDFVFGLLYQMRNIVGEDRGEAFIYDLRNNITTNSSIRNELIEGLLKSCDALCASPFNDRISILKTLNHKGI
jgi:hypothetical protein